MQQSSEEKGTKQKILQRSQEKLSLQACENYAANSDVKKFASKEYFEAQGCHTIASIMKLIRIRG